MWRTAWTFLLVSGAALAGAAAQTPAPAGGDTALSAYALRPEDVQPFAPGDVPATHRVSGDESLYDIATRYQVPLRALIDQNRLEPPYALSPGRELQLPQPRGHVVARGETLRDVAARYNVDYRSLALLNRLPPPYEVREGQTIYLPALARERAEAASPQSAPAPIAAASPTRSNGTYVWPLRGRVVGRFGAQSGGRRLDGIEIAAREGLPVVSAQEGRVVYAGVDLPAYGALILIRHPDGLVTAYAYGRRAIVREGQNVRAGEAVTEVGSNGRLLFQVRRGRDVVDPLSVLPR